MKKMRRWMSLAMGLLMSCQLLGTVAYAKPDWPSDTGVVAEAGLVMDVDSGTMIFGQNSRLPYYPASITKLLTALVVLEHASLDDRVTFSNDAVYNVEEGSGNYLGLDEGDELSVKDCLYGLLLRSSNQAANALAEYVGGSRDGFVGMMNEKIAELGCTDSRFKNPSGLNDPEQVVTPYDMALIAKAAFANPVLLEIASAKSYTLTSTKKNPEGFTFTQENKILMAADSSSQFYCEGAVAGKTGYTSIAGSTLVMYAERDGRRLVAVVLKGAPTQYYLDAINLLNFGFERFKNMDIAQMEPSYTAGSEPVVLGDSSFQPEELEFLAPSVLTLPETAEYGDAEKTLDTNVPEGSPEGTVAVLRYVYNERKVGEAYLLKKQAAGDQPSEGSGVTDTTAAEPVESEPQTAAADLDVTEPVSPAPEQGKSKNSGITGILIGIGIVLAVVVLAGIGWVVYEERQEKKKRELRRARRRTRLIESGISEEEFERLVAERRNKDQNSDKAE